MENDTDPGDLPDSPLAVEDLFDAEADLRTAAREYSSVEHGMCSIEVRRRHSRTLRSAARKYARIADAVDRACQSAAIESARVLTDSGRPT